MSGGKSVTRGSEIDDAPGVPVRTQKSHRIGKDRKELSLKKGFSPGKFRTGCRRSCTHSCKTLLKTIFRQIIFTQRGWSGMYVIVNTCRLGTDEKRRLVSFYNVECQSAYITRPAMCLASGR